MGIRKEIAWVLVFFAVAATGAGAGLVIHLPLPYLTGPAILSAVIAPTGLLREPPGWLRQACFVVIGIGMGSGVTPEALALARSWPVPLLAMGVFLLGLILLGAGLLRQFFGFERYGARLAATPGHLSFVIAMADELQADVARVTVLQALRILYITLLVPVGLQVYTGAPLPVVFVAPVQMSLPVLAGLAVVSVGVGLVMLRLRLPAALLLAGMLVSAVAHGAGFVEGAVPPALAMPVFACMGALIGTRFIGIRLRDMRQAALASLALALLALMLTFAVAEVLHLATGLPLLDLMIAFAPGGLETMAALSLMLGADPALVAVHHVMRLLYLSVMVPVLMPRPSQR